jgi:hypothetical protein
VARVVQGLSVRGWPAPTTADKEGGFMKTTAAIATIAFIFAGSTISTSAAAAFSEFAANVVVAEAAGEEAPSAWDGQWQGATVSGQQLVLDLRVKDQRLTGKLVVGKQSAKITEGKALDQAFALTTEKIDGHSVSATGRKVGDALELTIDGVKEPLTLTRIK